MARRRNLKGYCTHRNFGVQELNLCDYFEGKRKNSKSACKNCVFFQIIDSNMDKNVAFKKTNKKDN